MRMNFSKLLFLFYLIVMESYGNIAKLILYMQKVVKVN